MPETKKTTFEKIVSLINELFGSDLRVVNSVTRSRQLGGDTVIVGTKYGDEYVISVQSRPWNKEKNHN